MLDTFTKAFFHFSFYWNNNADVLFSNICFFHFCQIYWIAALCTDSDRHTEVAEYERLFLRSSAICQRFWGGEQWQLWGLQTDLTASFVGTFHRRFSYKCAQRDLSQRLKFPHIIALTLAQLFSCLRISFASSTSTEPRPEMEQAKQNHRHD